MPELAVIVTPAHTVLQLVAEAFATMLGHARAAGYRALWGHILNVNADMLALAAHLGFAESGRDGDVVSVVRAL